MTAPQRRPRDAARAARAAWAARNPHKVKAHALARAARRRGDLVPEPCEVCGSLHVEGHHPEYAAPLALRWLCPTHHRQEHIRIRREAKAARLSVDELLETLRATPEPIRLPAGPSAPPVPPSPSGEPLQRPHEAGERERRP